MSVEAAQQYHTAQVSSFASTAVDVITALTLNHVEEAIGVTLAAQQHGMPVVIGLTVEVDGRLPSGMSLSEAISAIDTATESYPECFLINCAHPSHFSSVLYSATDNGELWVKRLGGLRANASRLSHAELDACTSLDSGNPDEFGRQHAELVNKLPQLRILGGCCGTDLRHIEAVARACNFVAK